MNLDYCIVEGTDTSYNAIVIGLSSNSLTDFFDDISISLLEKKITGKVLLDYYNYNHSQKRRFFEADFENKITVNSLKKVNSESLQSYINQSYIKYPNLQGLLIK